MTKEQLLIDHLRRGKKVTRIVAMHEFDLQNLTAAISKLIQKGMNIKKRKKTDARGTSYTEYYLGRPHTRAAW